MSKEIFLYSEDKKYKCAVELADSLDQFKCPDHSVLVLFEEREDGTYIIAQARDKRLETEKDQKIAELETKLAESEKENKNLEDDHNKLIEQYNNQYIELCKEIKCHSSARERFVKKVKELEEQIEEKDKNFKWLHKNFATYMENNQDKISFCIEKLTDVRSFVSDATKIKEPDYTKVYNYIEKQIEQLKKGSE